MPDKECLLEKVISTIKNLEIYQYVSRITEKLNFYGISYYFVGGALRDIIIAVIQRKKKLFIEDIDIVIETNRYNDMLKIVNSINFGVDTQFIKYPQFLTLSMFLQVHNSNLRIDFSLPRKEKYPSYGALPEVDLGNIDEDLFRRDFTINAIALRYNLDTKEYYFYDPFCGIDDILRKRIRIMHEKSFFDDPTRIIRGIRFAANLGFKFDKWTKKQLIKAVGNGLLRTISHKRLVTEFVNILRKGQNLCSLVKMFKKFGIDSIYKERLGKFMEVFYEYCNDIELKSLKNEDKFYIRLLYVSEKLIGKITTISKNKAINELKKIMISLELPKTYRKPIFHAIHLLFLLQENKVKLDEFPSWLVTYVKLFY